VVTSLSTAACGAGTASGNGATQGRESTGGATREVTSAALAECRPDKTLGEDVRSYAKDENITTEEAARRLGLQRCYADDLADLERALRNKEADTFAGLWIQNQPEYRFVVLFTRDGEQTIRPYLEDESEQFRRLVEVRSGADATLKELHAALDEANRLVDRLDVRTEGTGTNIQKNRAEIYVTNKARFEAALREAGARLPEHVAVVEVEGHLAPG
jgi:hypothetical protein